MRPIDADALREVIEDHVTAVSCCPTVDWSRGKTEFKEQCLEDIDNAPTIDICDDQYKWWFSVKTILPEEDCDVLVYNGLGLEIAAYTTNPVPKWYGRDGHQVNAMFWRFLPELPKEVIED